MQTTTCNGAPRVAPKHRRLSLVLLVVLIELTGDLLVAKESQVKPSKASRSHLFGLAPVLADSYGDLVSGSSPAIEAALQDDDDEEDAELDSAASGSDYPDNDDEDSYGADSDGADEDGDNDRQDSRLHQIWTRPRKQVNRFKRELKFARKLRHRRRKLRAASNTGDNAGPTSTASLDNNKDEDFAIDDGDEDAWVHDGIDDIHIDPETKRAASELNRDNEQTSIDSEYDPNSGQAGQSTSASQPAIVNRTRITTIAEVIPLVKDEADLEDADDSSRLMPSTGRAPSMFASALPATAGNYLPAAYLSLDQVQELIDKQQQMRRRQDLDDDFEDSERLQRHLVRGPAAKRRRQPDEDPQEVTRTDDDS